MNNAGRIGFIIKGAYKNTATYDFLDVVYFENSSYVAKKLTTGNAPAENSEYWQLLAATPDNAVIGVKGAAETNFRNGNVTLDPADIGLGNVDNVKQMPLSEWTWTGSSGQPTWLWGGNEAHKYSVWNPANFNVNHASTASMPAGFGNRMDTASWGNQTGTCITCWNDDSSGSLQFRKNNPSDGQLSVLTDGYFYQREGLKRCLDESDKLPENIGNNGTGGISAGTGLQLETYTEMDAEFSCNVTAAGSSVIEFTYNDNSGTPLQTYGFQLSVNSQEGPANYLSRYEGRFLGKDKDVRFSNNSFDVETASFDGIFVKNGKLYSAYDNEEIAQHALENAAGSCIIQVGTKQHAAYSNQFLFGTYNNNFHSDSALIVGTGSVNSGFTSRKNALRLTKDSALYLGSGGAYNSSGADHAEFIKPWADGNPENEDRVGYLVTIKDGLLYKAEAGDYIAGITSGNPCVVGNADEDYYWKYERDEFNRIIIEAVPEEIQETDKNGNPVFDKETGKPIVIKTGRIIEAPKISENYNPAMQESYIERKDRKEWDYVGMLGVLPVRDDGTCLPGQFCKCKKGGIATLTAVKDFNSYFVIERISEHVVSVLFI